MVYFTWHRFNFAAALLFRAAPTERRPVLVMPDGLASRALTHESSTWLGFDSFVFHRRAPRSPRQQIIDFVRATGRPILNLPDAGGPYLRVKPGIVEIAVACDAVLQPFIVRSRGVAVVGRTLQHVVPLPFCSLEALPGEPIDPAAATVDRCQRSLDELFVGA